MAHKENNIERTKKGIGMITNADNVVVIKHRLIEQFRNELPVLLARTRFPREAIAEKMVKLVEAPEY